MNRHDSVPNPSSIVRILLGSLRCYIHVFTLRNWKYVIPVCPPPTGFPSRLELQLFSLEDDKCLSHVHTCSASSPHQPDASKKTGTETRRWHLNEKVSFHICSQEPLPLPLDKTIQGKRITIGPDWGRLCIYRCTKEHEIRLAIKIKGVICVNPRMLVIWVYCQ